MALSNIIPQLLLIEEPIVRTIVVFVVVYFVFRIVLQLLFSALTHASNKTETDLDDVILEKFAFPLSVISLLFSITISMQELDLETSSSFAVENTVYTIIVLTIGYTIYIVLKFILARAWQKLAKKKEIFDNTLLGLANNIIATAFYIGMFLYVLTIWGIEIGPMLTGLGIAGLAVALALQPTLGNVFSGITLILGKTFRIGDVIKTQNGELGIVHHIGLRTTRIKTFDNEIFIIPNSTLADSTIQNFFQPDKSVRVNLEFGVEYGVDPEYIKVIALEEINKIKFIDKKQDRNILFLAMADSALTFKAMYWVTDISKKWPAHQEGMTRIYRRLYKEGIGIPFPQQTVWLRDEKSVKSPSPSDKKFAKMKNVYLPKFGHKMEEEQKITVKKESEKAKRQAKSTKKKR